jgi:hypothetical protein
MVFISELIHMFSPVLFFHPEETYFPISIEQYLSTSSFVYNNPEYDEDVLVPPPRTQSTPPKGILLDTESICRITNTSVYKHSATSVPLVNHSPTTWRNHFNQTSPIYTKVTETPTHFLIQYIFLYAYNPPYTLGMLSFGGHDCDIEHITMKILKHVLRIDEIFFSAHRSSDGRWVSRVNLEMEYTHPILYIAKGSHAIYPRESVYFRIFGIANDHTSSKGVVSRPSNLVVINEHTAWNCFQTPTCRAPVYHEWWGDENGTTTNWLKMILGL